MRVFKVAAAAGLFFSISGFIHAATAQNAPMTWTGPYVGGHIGRLSGDEPQFPAFGGQAAVLPNVATTNTNDSMSAPIGGVHAGYIVIQQGNIVFGFEGDFSWTNADGGPSKNTTIGYSNDGCAAFECGIYTYSSVNSATLRSQMDWLASLRARAGVLPVNNVLLYLTGGVAFTDVTTRQSFNFSETLSFVPFSCNGSCTPTVEIFSSGASASDSKTLVGYVIGFGSEIKFNQNWSGRAEYLYYDFGSETFNLNFGEGSASQKVDVHANVFRIGLSYFFN